MNLLTHAQTHARTHTDTRTNTHTRTQKHAHTHTYTRWEYSQTSEKHKVLYSIELVIEIYHVTGGLCLCYSIFSSFPDIPPLKLHFDGVDVSVSSSALARKSTSATAKCLPSVTDEEIFNDSGETNKVPVDSCAPDQDPHLTFQPVSFLSRVGDCALQLPPPPLHAVYDTTWSCHPQLYPSINRSIPPPNFGLSVWGYRAGHSTPIFTHTGPLSVTVPEQQLLQPMLRTFGIGPPLWHAQTTHQLQQEVMQPPRLGAVPQPDTSAMQGHHLFGTSNAMPTSASSSSMHSLPTISARNSCEQQETAEKTDFSLTASEATLFRASLSCIQKRDQPQTGSCRNLSGQPSFKTQVKGKAALPSIPSFASSTSEVNGSTRSEESKGDKPLDERRSGNIIPSKLGGKKKVYRGKKKRKGPTGHSIPSPGIYTDSTRCVFFSRI